MKKFKVGDKVVPIDKTVNCELGSSTVWRQAQIEGQPYLYVNLVDNNRDVYVCNVGQKTGYGDFFTEKDLIPYQPEKNYTLLLPTDMLERAKVLSRELKKIQVELVTNELKDEICFLFDELHLNGITKITWEIDGRIDENQIINISTKCKFFNIHEEIDEVDPVIEEMIIEILEEYYDELFLLEINEIII